MQAHNKKYPVIIKGQPNKMPDQLKLVCELCFNELLENAFLPIIRYKIYDFLSSYGYINLKNSEIKEFYRKSQIELIENELKKPKQIQNIGHLKKKNCLMAIQKAKVLAVETYFCKIDAEEKTLSDILI
jgi:hypothetical protein